MTHKLNEKDFFQTADLALATAISLSYPLEAINRDERKAQFIFKRTAKFDDLIASYWRRELRVDPQSYYDAMRAIKGRLYESQ
jgi:hypothetical protein